MSEEAQDGLLDMKKHLEELRSLAEERGIDVTGEMLELDVARRKADAAPILTGIAYQSDTAGLPGGPGRVDGQDCGHRTDPGRPAQPPFIPAA